MKIKRLEDIEAWQPARIATQNVAGGLARELTRKVYRITRRPRFSRDFGLKGQIQSAAGSSMHNIAEGFDSERMRSSFVSYVTPNGLARKFRANSMLPWTKNIYRLKNSKKSMSRPVAHALPFMDSLGISKNTKNAIHQP